MVTMNKVLISLLAVGGIGLAGLPIASADPIGDAEHDVYGLFTPGEQQEVWASGQGTCVTLDRVYESSPPVKSDDVVSVIEGYRAKGWDLESANDIV